MTAVHSRPAAGLDEIRSFLHPDGVALLGRVMRVGPPELLLARERARWGERFYFVNPSGGTVGDIPIYSSLADLPGSVELAVISTGTGQILGILEDCAARGIRNVVIFTGGLREAGGEGAALEDEIAAAAAKLELRVLGPNTNTNAWEPMPPVPTRRTGRIGLVTQSGNQGRPFVQSSVFGVALSRWVATGNELDLDVADFIRYFAADAETKVVGAYVEGFRDGDKLRAALRAAYESRTPVVMLKVGQTEAGRRMATSHTGHLTGNDAVVRGLFEQYAVTRVGDVDELMETTNLFSKLPIGCGDRVAIYGASGGVTTLLAENTQQHGLQVPRLEPATEQRLREILPGYLSLANPVDNGMQFLMQQPLGERLKVLEIIASDPNVDVLVAGNNMAEGPVANAFVEDLVAFAAASSMPVICVWGTPIDNPDLFAKLVDAEIPIMRSARGALRSLGALCAYGRRSTGNIATASEPLADARAILAGASGPLSQDTALALLSAAGVATVEEHLVQSAAQAETAWAAVGEHAVLKLASPNFPHRSEHGLVRTDVSDRAAAAKAYTELVERALQLDPSASIDGVIVQRQVDDGFELIIGITTDPVLGSAVMIGFGGLYAEVLSDTAICPVPLHADDARRLLTSLRGYPLLTGVRGRPAVALDALVDMIVAVGRLAETCPELTELDLNPVIASTHGAVAVDVLAVASDGALVSDTERQGS